MASYALLSAFAGLQLQVAFSQYYHSSWCGRHESNLRTCQISRRSSEPFIGSDAFVDFANVTFRPGSKLEIFPGVKIFLCAADVAEFGHIVESIRVPFILITRSNLDELIPFPSSEKQESHLSAYTKILEHQHLLKWFGSNKAIHHQKLAALPLGPKWQWCSTAFHGEDDTKAVVSKLLSHYASDVSFNFYSKKRERLIYMSMKESSSETATYEPWRGSRRKAAQALRQNFNSTFEAVNPSYKYRTSSDSNGCDGHPELEQYLLELQHYKFVLSPPGNGPDVHRTWEALMMGCIPIVLQGPFDELYESLPVLSLTSWDQLTPKMLEQTYTRLRHGPQTFEFDRLFTPYWFDTINHELVDSHSKLYNFYRLGAFHSQMH